MNQAVVSPHLFKVIVYDSKIAGGGDGGGRVVLLALLVLLVLLVLAVQVKLVLLMMLLVTSITTIHYYRSFIWGLPFGGWREEWLSPYMWIKTLLEFEKEAKKSFVAFFSSAIGSSISGGGSAAGPTSTCGAAD